MMNFRITTYALAGVLVTAALNLHAEVRTRQSSSAASVAAELAKGHLGASSQPGDVVLLKLRRDLKPTGTLVLKKGSVITGIVRTVKRTESLSVVEIDWLTPAAHKVPQDLTITLQYVVQIPNEKLQEMPAADEELDSPAVASFMRRTSGQSNIALKSMPSVVRLDQKTTWAIVGSLGASESEELFRVGRGQLLTPTGAQVVDVFSRLCNDTVITSASPDFDISSGAQIQLLVGVSRSIAQTR
jgi:hypothetical protein